MSMNLSLKTKVCLFLLYLPAYPVSVMQSQRSSRSVRCKPGVGY